MCFKNVGSSELRWTLNFSSIVELGPADHCTLVRETTALASYSGSVQIGLDFGLTKTFYAKLKNTFHRSTQKFKCLRDSSLQVLEQIFFCQTKSFFFNFQSSYRTFTTAIVVFTAPALSSSIYC